MNEPLKNKVSFDFKIDLNTLLIAGLIGYLFFTGFFSKDLPKTETKTTTKIEYLKQLDSAINSRMSFKPKTPVKVAIKPNKEVRVLQPNEPLQENEKEIQLNEVKDTLKLKNATVFSTILTNGKIYSHKAIVFTNDKIITTDTQTKTWVAQSVTFLNIEPIFSLKGKVYGGDISIDRTIKNKIRFGTGIGYNDKLPTGEKLYIKAKLGIKF